MLSHSSLIFCMLVPPRPFSLHFILFNTDERERRRRRPTERSRPYSVRTKFVGAVGACFFFICFPSFSSRAVVFIHTFVHRASVVSPSPFILAFPSSFFSKTKLFSKRTEPSEQTLTPVFSYFFPPRTSMLRHAANVLRVFLFFLAAPCLQHQNEIP